jgi:hypothetical protein
VTWPGLDALELRSLRPGKTQLTTIVPPAATLTVEKGRWRPMSGNPEFINQVAVARWKAASTTALFALLPNLKDKPDVTCQAGKRDGIVVRGPDWTDRVWIEGAWLRLKSEDGKLDERVAL